MQGENDGLIAVVGSGLAGLAAATYLARAGRRVRLFEQSEEIGGRARTQERDGFLLNQGPHAIYRGGAGAPILRELGVSWTGKPPRTVGYALRDGQRHTFPGGVSALFSTSLLSQRAKIETMRFLATLPGLKTDELQRVSLAAWLQEAIRHADARQFIAALARVSTYAADAERQSAGAALAQVRLALLQNVTYIDGGWRTLVAALRRSAEESGVAIESDARIVAVERDPAGGAVRSIRLASGAAHDVSAVVLAVEPRVALAVVGRGAETPLQGWVEEAIPVRAACLDLALRALPNPRATVAFGIDHPTYLSVHSVSARLAPAGGALIHVARYRTADDASTPEAMRRELEAMMDQVQPGWRQELVFARFLPNMIVSQRLVTAAQGGVSGRPGPVVSGVPGLYVAGDWVGPTGMLTDAALASAKAAAMALLADKATVAPGDATETKVYEQRSLVNV